MFTEYIILYYIQVADFIQPDNVKYLLLFRRGI